MSLVTVMKVSLNFLERQIFNEIGLQVNPVDRIGLVGRNGSGNHSGKRGGQNCKEITHRIPATGCP